MSPAPALGTLVLLLATSATPALAGARQHATTLLSEDPALAKIEQEWGFSDAIVVGDTVYLSGIVAGTRVGDTDLTAAYGRAFERIGAILKRAGASRSRREE